MPHSKFGWLEVVNFLILEVSGSPGRHVFSNSISIQILQAMFLFMLTSCFLRVLWYNQLQTNTDMHKNLYNSELEQTLIGYLLTNVISKVSLLSAILSEANQMSEILSKFCLTSYEKIMSDINQSTGCDVSIKMSPNKTNI